MSENNPAAASRRRFLRDTLTLGAGATAAVVTAGASAATDLQPVEQDKRTEHRGYRETPHVADYYKTAGF